MKKTTLKTLIESCSFDYVNPDIEEFFNLEDVRNTDYKVFHFDRYLSSEDAITEMAKEGYESANHIDLLTWYPQRNGKDYVVALGSSALVRGCRRVVCLVRSGAECGLSLSHWVGDWGGSWRFLGVRNSVLGGKSQAIGDLESLKPRVEKLESKMAGTSRSYSRTTGKSMTNNQKSHEESHRTQTGYCCACGYDIAGFEERIKESYEQGRADAIDVMEKIIDKKKAEENDNFKKTVAQGFFHNSDPFKEKGV